MSENSLEKFKELLRILFQFDCVDLDFGIYRILNYKRSQVESFITERLPQIVDEAFARYAAADKAVVEQELEQTRQEIVNNLGDQAIDESGQLHNYHRTKLGQQYLLLMEKRARYEVANELKTRIYNDLFTFFSRYYEDGDFISKRRYGRHETYAIPYDGEEVMLYWANRDQYYVKTGDRFKAYRFKVGDYSVSFELRNVAPEGNGNGGKKRYFVLAQDAPITWNEQGKALAIAFEYRPLTEAEEREHGSTGQQKPQDSLNEAAEREIIKLVTDASLKAALAKPEGTNGSSLLHKHLTRFTRKNTADFFIHKDLRGFLRRELDFFIKNEVLLLDELITGGEEDLRKHVQRGRVVRQVAEAIIDFLAQVEDFQKKLWEKKKFVLRTEYCLTIDRVPEELWDEVLANEAQVAEWRKLYSIEGKATASFLKAHPTLVVDTRHFPEDFKWRLLANFDDLDEALDGLLIKSENWQALNLLLEKYRQRVKCVYIDPPYNTGSDEFIYRDRYQHSSWLSMMADRLALARELMGNEASIFVSIDDNEQSALRKLGEIVFGAEQFVNNVIWQKKYTRANDARWFSDNHDFIVIFAKNKERFAPSLLPRTAEQEAAYSNPDNDPRGLWKATPLHAKSGKGQTSTYTFSNGVAWSPPPGTYARYSDDTLQKLEQENRIWFGPGGKSTPARKSFLSEVREGVVSVTIWKYDEVGHNHEAIDELKSLFPDNPYSNPKPTRLIRRIANLAQGNIVLDFFAGSGTTAHAVINLNRDDGGKRKYILVEIGDWFETVMLPRIKKVVFCEKWKEGKPQGGPGVSHMLKYQYLEQYEDTLNNLELPREKDGQLAFEKFGDEYLLKYMLDFETQGSASLLNLDRFKDPFAYKLKVLEGDEIAERPVDLVETFNYLLGIQTKKLKTFKNGERLYRAVLGEKNGMRVAIVWRSVVGLEDNDKALMQDKTFIEQTVLSGLLGETKPDRLLVNGACFVKDVEAIEPEFHRLMFAPVGV